MLNNKVDWNMVLVRSSCAGKVMTDGKGATLTEKQEELLKDLQSRTKALTPNQQVTLTDLIRKRDTPPSLSDTCVSYLKEVYEFHRYGTEPIGGAARSKYVKKGNACEEESILQLNRFYKTANFSELVKNTIRENDEYKTGEADIVWRKKDCTIDTKSVWDMQSLLAHVPSPNKENKISLDNNYVLQGHCYMDLFNTSSHTVAYVLVNMPREYVEKEKYRIFNEGINAGQFVTEESIEYKKLVTKLEKNCNFDHIPIEERVVTFTFERDQKKLDALKERWEQCRKWLAEFEKLHLSIHKHVLQ